MTSSSTRAAEETLNASAGAGVRPTRQRRFMAPPESPIVRFLLCSEDRELGRRSPIRPPEGYERPRRPIEQHQAQKRSAGNAPDAVNAFLGVVLTESHATTRPRQAPPGSGAPEAGPEGQNISGPAPAPMRAARGQSRGRGPVLGLLLVRWRRETTGPSTRQRQPVERPGLLLCPCAWSAPQQPGMGPQTGVPPQPSRGPAPRGGRSCSL